MEELELKAQLADMKKTAAEAWNLVERIREAMGVDGFKAPETLPDYARSLRIRAGEVSAPPVVTPPDVEALEKQVADLKITVERQRYTITKTLARLDAVGVMARAVAQEARDDANRGSR